MIKVRPMAKNHRENRLLLFQELNGNPYRRLNIAFILISIIPILTFAYLLTDKLFASAYMRTVVFFACVILTLGYIVAYGVIKSVIDTTVSYAEKAKRADELKSSFAMGLAHDLKSPIITVNANMHSLKSGRLGELNPAQDKAVRVCGEVSERMSSIVSELMDTYMIEAHMTSLKKTRFDMRDIVSGQRSELEHVGGVKGITFIVELPEHPLLVDADKEKITRVLNNLLSNSIKFAPEGGRVTVKAYASDGFARLEIMNNGEPIPEDSLENIFDKFERLDESAEGHGLGLSIAKDIVELHKGKIWASSGPGRDNCFTLVLALAQTT